MFVTHPRYLPLPIEVLEELEDVRRTDSALGFDTLGNLHVHIKLDVGTRKGQDKVHMSYTPYIED